MTTQAGVRLRPLVAAAGTAILVGTIAAAGGANWWALVAAIAAAAGVLLASRSGRPPKPAATSGGEKAETTDDGVAQVAAASSDLSLLAHRIAAATASQQSMLDSIRDAVADLSTTSATTADSVAQSARLAATSRRRASDGSSLIRQLIDDLEQSVRAVLDSGETIAELANRVADVGTLAGSIDSVAARTRMLALNAAIEAARAGDQGRGFAVIAQEVEGLAQQAADAAARIAGIVSAITQTSSRSQATDAANRESADRMRQGLSNAQAAGEAFDGIVRDVDLLSRDIDDVASSSAEQALTAEQVLRSTGIVAVAAGATAASAHALGDTSERIERVTDLIATTAVSEAGQSDAAAAMRTITAALRPVFDVPREHAGRFLALLELSRATSGQIASADLQALDDSMKANLTRFRVLCGATVTLCPGVLSDQRLWMHWWVNSGDTQRRLAVDLDPESAAFYDYTAADWYKTPSERLATWLSDPYFDEGGAEAHIVTISVPATLDGQLQAIATGDLDLVQIGRLCAPGLESVARPAALVTTTGVVVASTTGSWPAGLPLPDAHREWVSRSTGPWTKGSDGWGLARSATLDWALMVRSLA